MTKITVDFEDSLVERLAAVSRARTLTVEEWLRAEAELALDQPSALEFQNSSHRAHGFIDTNVLFYAAIGRCSEPQKHKQAHQMLAETHLAVSGQALQAFYVNVTKRSDKPLTSEQAIQWMNLLIDRPCASIDHEWVVRGAEFAERCKISYWDGASLAGAERVRAPLLYTEDLNDGQFYGSLRAIHPFKTH